MAAVKKYAGLPDLDLDQEEIYETQVPELTEASTLPTESADESENENPDFDRAALNPDAARARFEPAIVDARNVNFSDAIDGGRRDYRTRSRRRRRRAALIDGPDGEDDSDDGGEETLQGRLARLRREAVELQAEIERREGKQDKDDDDDDRSAYEDTVDHQAQSDGKEDLVRGVEQLNKTLDVVSLATKRKKATTVEDEFLQQLDQTPARPTTGARTPLPEDPVPQSALSAIAAFSDRLTALEAVLGVSSVTQSPTTSVLPTLDILRTQIETLYATLSPRVEPYSTDPRSQAVATASTVHLDPLAAKIRHLISESKRLEESRRAAAKAFEELLETRDRHAHLFTHAHSSAHAAGTEARVPRNVSSDARPGSADRKDDMQQQFTSLFLDDQASKINALYHLLPTIQSLQPMLPVVLERLRALSVIHTGAAEVKEEMDEMARRLQSQEQDVRKWREAVESAERGMVEGKGVMKENVQVIAEAVKRLEERVRELKR